MQRRPERSHATRRTRIISVLDSKRFRVWGAFALALVIALTVFALVVLTERVLCELRSEPVHWSFAHHCEVVLK